MKDSRLVTTVKGEEGSGGVLITLAFYNVYAFKPDTVVNVYDVCPSIHCITGHSLGDIWAMEYCQDLCNAGSFSCDKQVDDTLIFGHLGVYSWVLSLEQFKGIPFQNIDLYVLH